MSYQFSSPNLPTGFSLVGQNIVISASAPSFSGAVTIVLTDGVDTVFEVFQVEHTVILKQSLSIELVTVVSNMSDNAYVQVNVIESKQIVSYADYQSFIFEVPIIIVSSIAQYKDEFTGLYDLLSVNGVQFNMLYYAGIGSPEQVSTFAEATLLVVFREIEPYGANVIGCGNAVFKNDLLNTARAFFNKPDMIFRELGGSGGCDEETVNGITTVSYTINTVYNPTFYFVDILEVVENFTVS